MKANPGGNIDPADAYGRDELIARIWEQLETQCVLLNAERRIGKTTVIKKMVAEPRDGWVPIFQDLEKVHSAEDFAREVYEAAQKHFTKLGWVLNLAQRIYEEHDFGTLKKREQRPWKNLLESTLQDLASQFETKGQRLILFWDEVPYMIANICQVDGPQAGIEVLDLLRSLRQEHTSLRMVFTGSIGLHHVLAEVQAARIPSEPVNDMFAIEVTPLAPAEAEALARDLIAGERLDSSDTDEAAACIAFESDYFPYYIHHIVSGLKQDGLSAEPTLIRELVARQLTDANNSWQLGHYRTRIDVYYQEKAKLALAVLDVLAASEEPNSVNAILSTLNSQSDEFDDREQLLQILKLLERDHYLARNLDGEYSFRFNLIRRWWQLDRGL